MCNGRRSCWPPPTGRQTPRSPAGWASAPTRCASGGPDSAPRGCPARPTRPRPARSGAFPPPPRPRARRRPARHPPKTACPPPPRGRRRFFPPPAEAEVKALACALPAEVGVPLSRWSAAELAAEAVTRGVVPAISPSTVGRWLAADAIRPWRHHSWIFPRDPDFAAKAARVLDLYARIWHGQPLGENEYVLCADEKTQLQALSRRHRDLPSAPGRIRRTEFEYRRGGTLAYLAAYDPHAARVLGRTAPSTGIAPFAELVEQVMSTEPYASAARVFWIVDNGSSHQGPHAVLRMSRTWPTAQLVHLPIHASWLNQIEIFFSIVQRKVIKPQNFADLTELTARLLAFQDRYNATAEPFDWHFGRKSLDHLLQRLAIHEPLAA